MVIFLLTSIAWAVIAYSAYAYGIWRGQRTAARNYRREAALFNGMDPSQQRVPEHRF